MTLTVSSAGSVCTPSPGESEKDGEGDGALRGGWRDQLRYPWTWTWVPGWGPVSIHRLSLAVSKKQWTLTLHPWALGEECCIIDAGISRIRFSIPRSKYTSVDGGAKVIHSERGAGENECGKWETNDGRKLPTHASMRLSLSLSVLPLILSNNEGRAVSQSNRDGRRTSHWDILIDGLTLCHLCLRK